jgi:hypothetical protein
MTTERIQANGSEAGTASASMRCGWRWGLIDWQARETPFYISRDSTKAIPLTCFNYDLAMEFGSPAAAWAWLAGSRPKRAGWDPARYRVIDLDSGETLAPDDSRLGSRAGDEEHAVGNCETPGVKLAARALLDVAEPAADATPPTVEVDSQDIDYLSDLLRSALVDLSVGDVNEAAGSVGQVLGYVLAIGRALSRAEGGPR